MTRDKDQYTFGFGIFMGEYNKFLFKDLKNILSKKYVSNMLRNVIRNI